MKKAFIITSCIEPDNRFPLSYTPTRSIFTAEERFRQTVFTLSQLNLISDNDTKIYILDSSESWEKYKGIFSYYSNLEFIGVKEEFPRAFEVCKKHTNKSYAESTTIESFLTKYKNELKDFDYFIKLSGRYFFDSYFNVDILNQHNTDKLFFKNPLEFDFDETWNFDIVDRRQIQGNNKLYWYTSTLFAWGKGYHDKMTDIFRVISIMLNHPNANHYQIETLLYYFTRQFENDIIHVNWKVIGFDGASGNFIRY